MVEPSVGCASPGAREGGGELFAIALDALGSTAFLRAVHAYERPQMSAVYRTYLDLSELLPPLVYSVVLAFFAKAFTEK